MSPIQIFYKNTGKSTAFERDAEVRNLCSSLGYTSHLFTLSSHIMQRVKRDSSSINELWVYPYEGRCTVMFKDGHLYEYTNVSRRALFNVLVNPSVSLGKWVNKNCVNNHDASFEWVGHESPWIPCDAQLPSFL